MSDEMQRVVYELGGFRLDPLKRRLFDDGDRAVALTPKAFDTLLTLVKNNGSVVSKRELLDTVWENTAVEENNLTQQIAALRRAFGEHPGDRRFIVTVPGKGYTLIAPVNEIAVSADVNGNGSAVRSKIEPVLNGGGEFRRGFRGRARADGAVGMLIAAAYIGLVCILGFWPLLTGAERQSVAVLEFRASDEMTRELGNGIRDTLRAKIGSLNDVVLRPRSLTNRDDDAIIAGKNADADVVFSGSVQRSEDKVRVAIEMVDVRSSRVVWGQTFDYDGANRFEAQDKIAAAIIRALGRSISMAEISVRQRALSA